MPTHLAYLAETQDILHPEQVGGRKKRLAVDAALLLLHDIEMRKSNRVVMFAIMLDIKGAFENVSREHLLKTIYDLGLPKQYQRWVSHFMTGRGVALAFDNEKKEI